MRYPTAYKAASQRYRGTPSFQGKSPAARRPANDNSQRPANDNVPGNPQPLSDAVQGIVGTALRQEWGERLRDALENLADLGKRLFNYQPGGPQLASWQYCGPLVCSMGPGVTPYAQNWAGQCNVPSSKCEYAPFGIGSNPGAISPSWNGMISGKYKSSWKRHEAHWKRIASGGATNISELTTSAPVLDFHPFSYWPMLDPEVIPPLAPMADPNVGPAFEDLPNIRPNPARVVGYRWEFGYTLPSAAAGGVRRWPQNRIQLQPRNDLQLWTRHGFERVRYDRETKYGTNTRFSFLLKWYLGFLTEGLDLVGALWRSFPKDRQNRLWRDWYNRQIRDGVTDPQFGIVDQADLVWHNLDLLDWDKALSNILWQGFGDMVVGNTSKERQNIAKESGSYVTGASASSRMADLYEAVPTIVDPDYAWSVLENPDSTNAAKKAAQTFLDYDANAEYFHMLREYREQYFGFGSGDADRKGLGYGGVRW